MRKKGCTFEFAEERDRDLYRAYREITDRQLRLYGRITVTGLMGKVVNSPASRYWVSLERARSVMSRLDRGEMLPHMKRQTLRFYMSLYRHYRLYREKHPEASSIRILEVVTQYPAPCFTLSPRVAGTIIYRMKEKCRKETIRRLRPHSV